MTTPINSFQDILDAMERDPALRDALRQHILTEEFLSLPAQVKALTEAVEALVSETRELRTGQEQIRAEVGELRAEVGDLRAGQQELRVGQEEIKADVSEIKIEVGRLGGNVSNMLGTGYEGKVARVADRLARRNLGLGDPKVVMKSYLPNPTPPLPEVDQGAESGNITWEESDDLALADVIVSGTGQDGKQVYVVMEISITVQEKDKTRALRRAGLLERATGVSTIPVVIGISEEAPESNSGVAFWEFDADG